MSTEREGAGAFETLWESSGLARVADRVSPGATLTPRLLDAAAGDPAVFAATLAQELRRERGASPAAPAGASLPRITLVTDGDGFAASAPNARVDAELRVVDVLGEGGMGRVLLAHQRSLGRDVAVKVLRPEAATARGAEALLLEARLAGALEHPNVVPVHALGRDEHGCPVLVMKRVEGVSWSALLRDPEHPAWGRWRAAGAPDPAQARLRASLDVLLQVCNAVEFAHARGVVHRDLKPDNVLLGSFGEVYLADWGIALRREEPKAEGAGLSPERAQAPTILGAPAVRAAAPSAKHPMVGTPGYMAPEMLSGDPQRVDARTDVYLLGAVLHEVLTGEHRHAGRTLYEVLVRAYESAPVTYPADVPVELAAIANRATAAAPEARYATVGALREALAGFLAHQASANLARSAAARLDELRALVASTSAGAADPVEVSRLAAECRFACTQALRDWPDNADAGATLRALLALLAGYELERGSLEAARALLAELGADAPPALRGRLAGLEREAEEARMHGERLRREADEQDLQVNARERVRYFVALTALALCLSLAALGSVYRAGVQTPSYGNMLSISGTAMVALSVAFFVARRRLGTAVNRRIALAVVLAAGGMNVQRLVCWRLGVAPGAAIVLDTLLVGFACALLAVVLTPVLWGGAAVCLFFALLASFGVLPPVLAFSLASLVVLAGGVLVWGRGAKGEARTAVGDEG